MKYELRAATIDDVSILLNIKEKVFREQIEPYYGWDSIYQRQKIIKVLSKWPKNIYLVRIEDEYVAILTYFEAEEMVVQELFISPAYQGKGLGSILLTDIINKTRKNLTLKVNKKNNAIMFYQKLGFHVYGETDTHNLMRFINKGS